MAEKKATKGGPITSHMGPMISSLKKGESKDMAKGPRKMVEGEVSNQVDRPPKH